MFIFKVHGDFIFRASQVKDALLPERTAYHLGIILKPTHTGGGDLVTVCGIGGSGLDLVVEM